MKQTVHLYDEHAINGMDYLFNYEFNSKDGLIYLMSSELSYQDEGKLPILTRINFINLISGYDIIHMHFDKLKPITFIKHYSRVADINNHLMFGDTYTKDNYDQLAKLVDENKSIEKIINVDLEDIKDIPMIEAIKILERKEK